MFVIRGGGAVAAPPGAGPHRTVHHGRRLLCIGIQGQAPFPSLSIPRSLVPALFMGVIGEQYPDSIWFTGGMSGREERSLCLDYAWS